MTDNKSNHVCTYEELTAITKRWIELGWQKGDANSLGALHSANFTDHAPADRGSDLSSYMQSVSDLYTAFPNFFAEVNNLVVDVSTQQVAILWTATGTHKSDFWGVTATDKTIRFYDIEIIRIENGLISERWGEWDGLDLLDQLRKGI